MSTPYEKADEVVTRGPLEAPEIPAAGHSSGIVKHTEQPTSEPGLMCSSSPSSGGIGFSSAWTKVIERRSKRIGINLESSILTSFVGWISAGRSIVRLLEAPQHAPARRCGPVCRRNVSRGGARQ
jgi:hypothetical protein